MDSRNPSGSGRRREADVLKQEKLLALGRMAGGVIHDFNNLLSVIVGYAGLVADHVDPGTAAWEDLEEVRKAATTGQRLTRRILRFIRGDEPAVEAEHIDLNRLLDEFRSFLGYTLGPEIRLEYELAAELPRIRADAGMLLQVVLNLAANARDAMPGGGRLRVATALHSASEDDAAGGAASEDDAAGGAFGPSGGYVRLTVEDNGEGMDDAVRARIFDIDFSTKPADRGTGLGLATVRTLVGQMGGRLEIDSAPGRGTRWDIDFGAGDVRAHPGC